MLINILVYIVFPILIFWFLLFLAHQSKADQQYLKECDHRGLINSLRKTGLKRALRRGFRNGLRSL